MGIHCEAVFRHLAKFSSGISNLWCHITLSQTLHQLLPPRTEVQLWILVSQPDKKIEMLMICWRQEVCRHRGFAPAQPHPGAPAADLEATAPEPRFPSSRIRQQILPRQRSLWRGGRKQGSVEAIPGNADLLFHNQRF